MKKSLKKWILISLVLIFNTEIFCDDKDFGIGIGWPFLSLKYNFLKKISSEVRFATSEGINVFSLRGYYNFYSIRKENFSTYPLKNINLKCFSGIELGYITFNTMSISGNGYEGSAFIAAEYFLTKSLSFLVDFTPTFVYLNSEGVSVEGFEMVTNLVIYYYLW
ncbi:MAG: hypothetical protein N2Z73_03235 [Endomicrobia bacterium]|nr:hypothetical protein [Endomicrobiia bacterium]